MLKAYYMGGHSGWQNAFVKDNSLPLIGGYKGEESAA